jgi:hypothetical protein
MLEAWLWLYSSVWRFALSSSPDPSLLVLLIW